MGYDPATFNSDISVKDITLSGALEGKTVSSVSYISSEEINVTLTGDVSKIFDTETGEGILTISKRALKNDGDSFCYVNVYKPILDTSSAMKGGSSTNMKAYSTYKLPYGSFTEFATLDHIKLKDETNGTLQKVNISEDKLSMDVAVIDYNPSKEGATSFPILVMESTVTTFNVEISIYVGYGFASCNLF